MHLIGEILNVPQSEDSTQGGGGIQCFGTFNWGADVNRCAVPLPPVGCHRHAKTSEKDSNNLIKVFHTLPWNLWLVSVQILQLYKKMRETHSWHRESLKPNQASPELPPGACIEYNKLRIKRPACFSFS